MIILYIDNSLENFNRISTYVLSKYSKDKPKIIALYSLESAIEAIPKLREDLELIILNLKIPISEKNPIYANLFDPENTFYAYDQIKQIAPCAKIIDLSNLLRRIDSSFPDQCDTKELSRVIRRISEQESQINFNRELINNLEKQINTNEERISDLKKCVTDIEETMMRAKFFLDVMTIAKKPWLFISLSLGSAFIYSLITEGKNIGDWIKELFSLLMLSPKL